MEVTLPRACIRLCEQRRPPIPPASMLRIFARVKSDRIPDEATICTFLLERRALTECHALMIVDATMMEVCAPRGCEEADQVEYTLNKPLWGINTLPRPAKERGSGDGPRYNPGAALPGHHGSGVRSFQNRPIVPLTEFQASFNTKHPEAAFPAHYMIT